MSETLPSAPGALHLSSLWASILIASLLLLAVTLAGCAQSAVPSNPSSAPSASSNNPGGSSAVVSSPTVVSPASGNLVAENKTGFDKNQTTIASILPDGNYEKQVTYAYHSGNSTVDFKLIVQNDVITSASAEAVNDDKVSTMIIGKFNGALPSLVVGKKINELGIPKNVAGSSLTTAAFKQYAETLVQSHGAA